METWAEMSNRHAKIEEDFQEARYRDFQVLRGRFGEQIPPQELQAFEQHFGQARHAQIIKERYNEAQRHPERPQDKEQDRSTNRPQSRSQEAAQTTGSPQQERPTVYQRPISLEQHYEEQKAYQAQSLADADRLWNERLDRQQSAEAQQKAAQDQTLNSYLNPLVNAEKTAEQRREQERHSSPATRAEYVQYQKQERANEDPSHSVNKELHPKLDITKPVENRRDEERERRIQAEREKLKQQQERKRERSKGIEKQ